MQLTSAIPTSAYIGLASSTPAADELDAAKHLVNWLFDALQIEPGNGIQPIVTADAPLRQARTWSSIPLILASGNVCIKRQRSDGAQQPNDIYFSPEKEKAQEHDALRLDCSSGADPWEAREPVPGAGAVRLIRNFQNTRNRRQPTRELPMVPIAPLRPESALETPFIQESAEFISKATRIIILCVNQAMEERIIQCRYERFLERANSRTTTFIPNSNRLAPAYKQSSAAKVGSSSSFAYRGSLLATIRGQFFARQAPVEKSNTNPLDEFELQPNFDKGKDAQTRHYQDNAFLPNWRKHTQAKPQLAEEFEQSEETKRLQIIQNTRQSSFLPRARRQYDVAMPTLPLWNRNSWMKTVKTMRVQPSHHS